jgi:hypothetical protein
MAEGGGLRAQFDALTPRDRKLLAGLLVTFGLIVVVGVGWTLNRTLRAKAELVASRKEALALVQAFADRHAAARMRIQAGSEGGADRNLAPSAFLERTASTVGVRDQFSVTKLTSETEGALEETRYRVELARVPIDLSHNYLYDVETSGMPLAVETAKWRVTSRGDVKEANLTLELVSYALQGGS